MIVNICQGIPAKGVPDFRRSYLKSCLGSAPLIYVRRKRQKGRIPDTRRQTLGDTLDEGVSSEPRDAREPYRVSDGVEA